MVDDTNLLQEKEIELNTSTKQFAYSLHVLNYKDQKDFHKRVNVAKILRFQVHLDLATFR